MLSIPIAPGRPSFWKKLSLRTRRSSPCRAVHGQATFFQAGDCFAKERLAVTSSEKFLMSCFALILAKRPESVIVKHRLNGDIPDIVSCERFLRSNLPLRAHLGIASSRRALLAMTVRFKLPVTNTHFQEKSIKGHFHS